MDLDKRMKINNDFCLAAVTITAIVSIAAMATAALKNGKPNIFLSDDKIVSQSIENVIVCKISADGKSDNESVLRNVCHYIQVVRTGYYKFYANAPVTINDSNGNLICELSNDGNDSTNLRETLLYKGDKFKVSNEMRVCYISPEKYVSLPKR